ncbi:MAG: hypothetical protein MJ252_14760 [archaeon]|nr:hypothetical protein [archaeon]
MEYNFLNLISYDLFVQDEIYSNYFNFFVKSEEEKEESSENDTEVEYELNSENEEEEIKIEKEEKRKEKSNHCKESLKKNKRKLS